MFKRLLKSQTMELNNASDKLIKLPPEIRDIIYNCLKQKDALTLRLVSKEYRDEIDSMFRFKIQLDEENMPPEAIQFLLNKKIEKCEVVNLIKNKESLPIFKTPVYIKCLDIRIHGKISPDNLYNILRECSPYLNTLRVTFNQYFQYALHRFESHPLMSQFYDFDNLKHLRINQTGKSEAYLIPQQILKSAEKAKLKSLNIDWNGLTKKPKSHSAVFALVFQKRKTLKEFTYNSQTINIIPPVDKTVANNLLKVNDLKMYDLTLPRKKRFFYYPILPWHAVNFNNDLSVKLLHVQKQLEELKVSIFDYNEEQYESVCLPRIIINNCLTLRSISLTIEPAYEWNFDLAVFKDCQHLELLSLQFTEFNLLDSFHCKLVNLFMLPKGIEILMLSNSKILSVEMEKYFERGEELKSLSSLCISGVDLSDDSDEYGVNDSVLDKILSLEGVSSLMIDSLKLSTKYKEKMNSLISNWHSHAITPRCSCKFENNNLSLWRY